MGEGVTGIASSGPRLPGAGDGRAAKQRERGVAPGRPRRAGGQGQRRGGRAAPGPAAASRAAGRVGARPTPGLLVRACIARGRVKRMHTEDKVGVKNEGVEGGKSRTHTSSFTVPPFPRFCLSSFP